MVVLTDSEAASIVGIIGMLSGGNAENVFAWDGSDDPSDPGISGPAKLYKAAGDKVPATCEGLPLDVPEVLERIRSICDAAEDARDAVMDISRLVGVDPRSKR